ncbi:MAG: outer membrane protein assembly factor BamC [Methylococcales bacterium]
MNMIMRVCVLFTVTIFLGGCGLLKSVFPDKEKDYRFTREFPALVIPEDLVHPEIVKPPVSSASVADPQIANRQPLLPAAEPNVVPEAVALEEAPIPVSSYAKDVAEADAPVETKITLQTVSNNILVLHVNQNLQRASRLVGKAMTLEALEIVERNAAEHYYVLQYEPKAKAMKDDSIWDNVTFLFGAENNQEQAYRIALTENDQQTEIRVLDTNNKVCEVDACAELIKLLKTAMEDSLKE